MMRNWGIGLIGLAFFALGLVGNKLAADAIRLLERGSAGLIAVPPTILALLGLAAIMWSAHRLIRAIG